MKRTLNDWRHCWKEDFTEEKESYLLFVSISMKLVILLQDVHRRRLTKKEASTKIERRMIEKTTKARSHATLLMNKSLMKMMMK